MNSYKKTKGITLLSLIITIVVLIILASITIASISKDGIIDKAEIAKKDVENAEKQKNDKLKELVDIINSDTTGGHIHIWSDWVIEKAATCTAIGIKSRFCTVEGCSNSQAQDINPTGHNYTYEVIKAATTTSNGEGKYSCAVCGYSYTIEIPMSGHTCTEGSGTVTKVATCTETGTRTYYCTTCNAYIRQEPIDKLAHSTDSGTVTKQATCTTTGTRIYKCTVCKTSLGTATIDALGHNWAAVFNNINYGVYDAYEFSGVCTSCGTVCNHPLGAYTPYVKKNDGVKHFVYYGCPICGEHYRTEDCDVHYDCTICHWRYEYEENIYGNIYY